MRKIIFICSFFFSISMYGQETVSTDTLEIFDFDYGFTELHYDDQGIDNDEFVEFRIPADSLSSSYAVLFLSGTTPNGFPYYNIPTYITSESTYGCDGYAYYTVEGPEGFLRNADYNQTDGVMLVNVNNLEIVDWISYEGRQVVTVDDLIKFGLPVTPELTGGYVAGKAVDIGVEESDFTLEGSSLYLDTDDVWKVANGWNTKGRPNPLGCSSLPVQLVKFSGKNHDNSIVLSWITLSETNNNYFSVEKSIDGISFFEIGRVNGKINSSTEQFYQFEDQNPSAINYYRLKQVDLDGSSEMSHIINVNNATYASEISVYNKTLFINTIENGSADIEIFTTSGQLLKSIQKNINKKDKIDLKDISGLCIIKANINGQIFVEKAFID